MNAPLDPATREFVKALARAQVARDIAALRAALPGGQQGEPCAHGHLRALQQR